MNPNLTQFEIDVLNDIEYSEFLAYGDTFNDPTSIYSGAGSDILRKGETVRFDHETGKQVLQFGKRLRGSLNEGRSTIAY
jgi:hypothetical protein